MTSPPEAGRTSSTLVSTHLDWTSASRLPVVFGGLVWLRGHCVFCRRSFFVELFDDAPRPRRIDVDPGAYRAGQGNSLDVAALGRGRLGADDLVDERGVVLEQLLLVEALPADRDVDVRAAVGAVLELALLRLVDGLADVLLDVACLRMCHFPALREDAAELADDAHLFWVGDCVDEVVEPLVDP